MPTEEVCLSGYFQCNFGAFSVQFQSGNHLGKDYISCVLGISSPFVAFRFRRVN